jgi:predicted Zn-dependent peptidase
MKIEKHTLPNKLKVIFIDTEAFPSITSLLLIGAGSRYETQNNNGVAHFFEHMVFKGGKKYKTAEVIATTLDAMGSSHNAFTGKDYTGYYIKATKKHYEKSLDILSDVVLQPSLQEIEIEKEKGVIVEEINMYEDMPHYKVWDLFEDMLYKNNPLGYSTTGEKATVLSFNKKTFSDYRASLYHPNNAVLIVAGGLAGIGKKKVNISEYLNIATEKFGAWKKAENLEFKKYTTEQNKPNVLVHSKKTEQAHLVLGYRGVERTSEERYVLSLLTTILGGGMSSRLFQEVREKRGLCYYIQSGAETFAETGYVYTRAGVPIVKEKIIEAVTVTLNEHQKISSGKFSEEELIKAKEMIKGRLILSLEDTYSTASFFGKRQLLENETKTPEEVIKNIEKVTKDQVTQLADKLFKQNKFNFAIISPFENLEISRLLV